MHQLFIPKWVAALGNEAIDRGIADGTLRVYGNTVVPVVAGGDETEGDALFPDIPDSFAELSDDELDTFIAEARDAVRTAAASPASFVSDDFSAEDLIAASRETVEALRAARAELASRGDDGDDGEPAEPAEPVEPDTAAADADFSVLDELAAEVDDEPEAEPVEPVEPEAAPAAPAVTASATAPTPSPRRRPARSRGSAPLPDDRRASMTAAAPNLGFEVGEALPSPVALAEMMEKRRGQFGTIPHGTRGEKIPIARTTWRDMYPADRQLTGDHVHDWNLIASAVDPEQIKREMARRREGALTASGGLCAPVTPYYQLQMLSVAMRPVRAALPAFAADRGGIRYARPATLADVTTGVGVKTAAEDAAGGTEALKSCQVVECPPFQETDVQIIYHCLQFGNLGARTFPERVAQWNGLTLAAHARLAESELLTGIDTASTQVTASSLGLGASATLPSQILAAAAGMRSRHRMDPEAVLRVMLPSWVLDLLVSDVYRSQFDRFSMTGAQFVALLRAGNVEPSFYIDGADGRGQVFNAQTDGGLEPFPENVVWYLFPEGSFLFLDDGVLELGLVRDSVLNKTNDFQIFGESFENVAFVGIESLAVETPVCDTGIVSGPIPGPATPLDCPYDYTVS